MTEAVIIRPRKMRRCWNWMLICLFEGAYEPKAEATNTARHSVPMLTQKLQSVHRFESAPMRLCSLSVREMVLDLGMPRS